MVIAGALKATSTFNISGRENGRADTARPQDVQCARNSPCAHARHMARRLALLTLLACAAAVRHPPQHSADISDSDSLDPFSVWDDYDSYETTPTPRPRPRPRPTPTSAKVLLKGKNPKVNVTMKNAKGEDKKLIKTTNINIESHTNFIVTKSPPVKPNSETGLPVVQIGDQYMLVESSNMDHVVVTRKPATTRRPVSRRPSTSRRPALSSSRRPPTGTSRRPPTSTRRTTTRPMRKTKTTKKPNKKKTTCPPKNSGWLSSFFEENSLKKISKTPEKSGWFSGLFTKIFSWFKKSKSSWFFDGIWFFNDITPKRPVTYTTPEPFTTAPSSWFQTLLDNEEIDEPYIMEDDYKIKKRTKKAMKKNYKGYQLLRTYPDVQWKVQEMINLQEEAQGSGVMWWTPPSFNSTTDLLVPPDLLVDVKDHLRSNNIVFDVVIRDLQNAINYENPRLSKKQRLELEFLRGHPLTWRRYHRYADILRYLEYLQHSHADLVELIPLGRSSEGLPLVAVKISLSVNEDHSVNGKKKKWKLRSRTRPAVWIDGGAHAREWIAPAVATWIIHALVEGEKDLGAEYDVLKQADFYIMPVLNPDGYEHSHTHDRLWRKTRSRQPDHSDDYYVGWFPWNWGQTECVGVDADRNWDYHWSEKDSSLDPCSDNYAGPHPFSEPETRAVSEFLLEHKGQIKLYLSLHAYSQAWLVPSSHAQEEFVDDGVLTEMGKLATSALADLYGTKYQVGTAAKIRQAASGMSHDWAKARAGIKFSYHIDLRDSFGPYGFLLPGSQIVSTARETWQAVKAIVDNLSPGM